jgi:hypothetical protein
MNRRCWLLLSLLLPISQTQAAGIERIWLTHQSNDPSALVVNWETDVPSDSIVEFGPTPELGERAARNETETLHHVEIPLSKAGGAVHYRVRSGTAVSAVHRIEGYSRDELRVVVIADAGFGQADWVAAVLKERPHLLVSAGDHVPALHAGNPVAPETTTAFSQLVNRAPELFRTTPWLPLLGNHDREIRPRGPKPPLEPAYDIEAKAFREFFALPDEEWRWHFDAPEFGVRFVALDLSHLRDLGTTWQTCHPFDRESEQFRWYRGLMNASTQPFVVTFYNERNSQVRGLEQGEWGRMIERGTMAVTGFGYFGERAEVDGFTYYNTSVSGIGTRYPDPKSVVCKSEDNYLLITIRRTPVVLTTELKNLSGVVLDRKELAPIVRAVK